jgi:hypothetical protein
MKDENKHHQTKTRDRSKPDTADAGADNDAPQEK